MTRVARTEGDGTTSVELVGTTAPASKTGLSNLGTSRSSGTTTTRTLIDGAKAAFDAVITGVADWKDNPGEDINEAIRKALLDAALDAADRATDNLPMVKAFKIAVKLELAFVDGVGAEMERRGKTLRDRYRRGELAGMGPEGYSDDDAAAMRDLRAWQANNVAELNGPGTPRTPSRLPTAGRASAAWPPWPTGRTTWRSSGRGASTTSGC